MLQNTFCHLPGVGPKTEQRFWGRGYLDWQALLGAGDSGGSSVRRVLCDLEESCRRHDLGDALYFGKRLPPAETWRLFREYRHQAAYVDIETTGLLEGNHHITSIALYDGHSARTYVHGRNLESFQDDILDYKLLVTFNGKCFDVPFIEREFGTRLDMAHIDLRYVLRALGFKGGLKRIEKAFDLGREELEGVDGLFAVHLWNEFETTRDERCLETLLAYNVADVLSLEILLHTAYNRKLETTPFLADLELDVPGLNFNPHQPDQAVVERIRQRCAVWW